MRPECWGCRCASLHSFGLIYILLFGEIKPWCHKQTLVYVAAETPEKSLNRKPEDLVVNADAGVWRILPLPLLEFAWGFCWGS